MVHHCTLYVAYENILHCDQANCKVFFEELPLKNPKTKMVQKPTTISVVTNGTSLHETVQTQATESDP